MDKNFLFSNFFEPCRIIKILLFWCVKTQEGCRLSSLTSQKSGILICERHIKFKRCHTIESCRLLRDNGKYTLNTFCELCTEKVQREFPLQNKSMNVLVKAEAVKPWQNEVVPREIFSSSILLNRGRFFIVKRPYRKKGWYLWY